MFALLLYLLSTGTGEPFPPGFSDRPGMGADGVPVVIRTGLWPDFQGRHAWVEQVLLPNPDGSFTYQFARQTRATRMYHATWCGYRGLHADEAELTTSGPGTYGGWSCAATTLSPARRAAGLAHPTEPP